MVCCFALCKFCPEDLHSVTPIETTDSSGLFVSVSRESAIQIVEPSHFTWVVLMTENIKTGCAGQYIHGAAQWNLTGYPHEQDKIGDA